MTMSIGCGQPGSNLRRVQGNRDRNKRRGAEQVSGLGAQVDELDHLWKCEAAGQVMLAG